MKSQIRRTRENPRAPSWKRKLKLRQVVDVQVTTNWLGVGPEKNRKPSVDLRVETIDRVERTIELFLSPSEAKAIANRLIEEADKILLTTKHWDKTINPHWREYESKESCNVND